MSGTKFLTESVSTELVLTEPQLDELARLSVQMVGTLPWWGDAQDGDSTASRRIVQITPRGSMRYSVTVRNAIGAIGLPGMGLVIQPKIPFDHFAYLAAAALGVVPRRDDAPVELGNGRSFTDLVMAWFVDAASVVLQRGLTRGYRSVRANRPSARGSLHLRPTVDMWLKGQASIDCTFDVFDTDTPENRVLAAACRAVGRSLVVSQSLRRRALRLLDQMPEVGMVAPQDFRAITARAPHYVDALRLARQVLAGVGRSLTDSEIRSRTFLVYTPDIVEQGVRRVLNEGLAPIKVKKRKKTLVPSTVTVSPDLLAEPPPFTADVKYKIAGAFWNRPDLAQAVFFASAFGSAKAATISFQSEASALLNPVTVGHVEVTSLLWDTRVGSKPEQSASNLVRSFAALLERHPLSAAGLVLSSTDK